MSCIFIFFIPQMGVSGEELMSWQDCARAPTVIMEHLHSCPHRRDWEYTIDYARIPNVERGERRLR